MCLCLTLSLSHLLSFPSPTSFLLNAVFFISVCFVPLSLPFPLFLCLSVFLHPFMLFSLTLLVFLLVAVSLSFHLVRACLEFNNVVHSPCILANTACRCLPVGSAMQSMQTPQLFFFWCSRWPLLAQHCVFRRVAFTVWFIVRLCW